MSVGYQSMGDACGLQLHSPFAANVLRAGSTCDLSKLYVEDCVCFQTRPASSVSKMTVERYCIMSKQQG